MGHDVLSTYPKYNLEEELQITMLENEIQQSPTKEFWYKKNTIKWVVKKLNMNLLTQRLQQAGRLAEYSQ